MAAGLRKFRSSLGTCPALVTALATQPSTPAHAEGRLRIAKQFGTVYLLLNVAQDKKLVEKHGKGAGVDIKVEYEKLSGGASVNDALLAGSIDFIHRVGAIGNKGSSASHFFFPDPHNAAGS